MSAGVASVHMGSMSDSAIPRQVMHDFQIDRLIEATKKAYDGWLERLVKNGPDDLAAASEVAACSARYNQLISIKRGYFN